MQCSVLARGGIPTPVPGPVSLQLQRGPLRKAGALGGAACSSTKGPVSGRHSGWRAGSPDQSSGVFRVVCDHVVFYYYYYYCRPLPLCPSVLYRRSGKELLSPPGALGSGSARESCGRWAAQAAPSGSRCSGLSGSKWKAGAMLCSCTVFTSLPSAVSGAPEHFLLHLLAHLGLPRGAVADICSIKMVVVCSS